MKYDELKRIDPVKCRNNVHRNDIEHRTQVNCVRWFNIQYPFLKHNLFAVPNGGIRNITAAKRLKDEGVLPGVSDLILLKSNRFYGALLIEMKTSKGKQSEKQKEWQQKITKDGYKYVVCRSVEEFISEVKKYISEI